MRRGGRQASQVALRGCIRLRFLGQRRFVRGDTRSILFPDDPIRRYNLACYECQLGRLEQAKNWLGKAFELGDGRKLKLMALDDPDLEPLWKNIGEI